MTAIRLTLGDATRAGGRVNTGAAGRNAASASHD